MLKENVPSLLCEEIIKDYLKINLNYVNKLKTLKINEISEFTLK